MSYWITTHWPPFEKDKPKPSSPDPEYHYRVSLPNGRQNAGQELSEGDLVFIYESKTGRPLKSGGKYAPGRKGVIALVSPLTSILEKPDGESEEYQDGSSICWKWQARTQVKKLGFCSHDNVCSILGYKRGYTFHGFGDQHSGLKRIDEETFKALLKCFRAGLNPTNLKES